MEDKINFIEPLLERVEEYGKTNYELFKLKTVDKTGNVLSTLVSRLLLMIVLSFSVFTLNIAIALWVGDLLGKNYYGFLVVAAFYALIGIILFFIHPFIKTRINNSIITQLLK